MTLHDWLGRHFADFRDSHWDGGHFVSNCTICHREMIKPPGLPWRLRGKDS